MNKPIHLIIFSCILSFGCIKEPKHNVVTSINYEKKVMVYSGYVDHKLAYILFDESTEPNLTLCPAGRVCIFEKNGEEVITLPTNKSQIFLYKNGQASELNGNITKQEFEKFLVENHHAITLEMLLKKLKR